MTIPGRDPSVCPIDINSMPQCAYTTRAKFSATGAGHGALIGGGAGFALGALLKSDTWSGISLDALPRRVSLVAPVLDDRRLGLSISF